LVLQGGEHQLAVSAGTFARRGYGITKEGNFFALFYGYFTGLGCLGIVSNGSHAQGHDDELS
jgi:hypothetical protein